MRSHPTHRPSLQILNAAGRSLGVLALLAAGVVMAAPAHAAGEAGVPRTEALAAEEALDSLGLPVGNVNGKLDAYTGRGLCTWRELAGRKASRSNLRAGEVAEILATTSLKPAPGMVVGLNVNRTCQTLTWVVRDSEGSKRVKAVFPVSTGMSGHATPTGKYTINRQINGWHESTKYAGAMMYRPKYFNGGIALHGSATDAYVLPYPASHGCVRMLHRDIDRLWKANVTTGTTVRVYG